VTVLEELHLAESSASFVQVVAGRSFDCSTLSKDRTFGKVPRLERTIMNKASHDFDPYGSNVLKIASLIIVAILILIALWYVHTAPLPEKFP
jgi:hypothetical protein